MDTATKAGIDAAKTVSKRVVQKTAEATSDLIGNKIADKITSLGKPKEKLKNKRNRRTLYSTGKKTTNYWWLEIVLNAPLNENGISKNCKFSQHKLWWEFTKIYY